jgi:hypothetical protein
MPWQDWAVAVLSNLSAPSSPTNLATLLGWTAQEKTGLHPAPPIGPWATQWDNPLNTTQPWPGAINVNPAGVKQYLSLADGAGATVATLNNGLYTGIVANLRASLPASWWTGAARTELDTWGTGQVWLDFVPLTGDVMATIDDIYNMLRIGTTVDGTDSMLRALATGLLPAGAPYNQAPSLLQKILDQDAKQASAAQLTQAVTDLKAAIAAITAGGLTAAQATQLTQAHDAIVRIETALRAA